MKKICYVVTIPQTIRAFFIPQLQYLAENGFDMTVICSQDETLQIALGKKIRFIPLDIPRGIAIGKSIKVINQLTNIFRLEKFDLVQYSTPNAAMYASIAAKRAGVEKRNYHLMGFRFLGEQGVGKIFLKIMEWFVCNISTSIECVSKSNLELGIKEHIFDRKKAVVVWNGSTGGVDINRFDYQKRLQWRLELRNELGYLKSDFIYGFVGRITRDKGINELLEAFLTLNDGSKLFIIGSLEGESTLNKEIWYKANTNELIKICNNVSDIERYYALMDVLVLPSYREGLGNVIIEAASVGTPAIVSDIPGPVDTVKNMKTALIVPIKDKESLRTAMIKIRKIDYKVMGFSAYEYVRDNFDSEVLVKEIYERKYKLMSI